ncbi:MAG: DNA polymerase III subunit chi [Novosphingobium sp.]
MRVDFYQLSRDPAEAALPLIARAALNAGERLLVVSADEDQLGRIGDMLWTKLPETFLAHGRAGLPHAEHQPILLSDAPDPVNGAKFMAIADGVWREGAEPFARTFYMFDEVALQAARDCWRSLGTRDGVERKFWKQQGGKWVEGP